MVAYCVLFMLYNIGELKEGTLFKVRSKRMTYILITDIEQVLHEKKLFILR
jgi:hypothetical protein